MLSKSGSESCIVHDHIVSVIVEQVFLIGGAESLEGLIGGEAFGVLDAGEEVDGYERHCGGRYGGGGSEPQARGKPAMPSHGLFRCDAGNYLVGQPLYKVRGHAVGIAATQGVERRRRVVLCVSDFRCHGC